MNIVLKEAMKFAILENFERWLRATTFFESEKALKLEKEDLPKYNLYLEEFSKITSAINGDLEFLEKRLEASEYLSLVEIIERRV